MKIIFIILIYVLGFSLCIVNNNKRQERERAIQQSEGGEVGE